MKKFLIILGIIVAGIFAVILAPFLYLIVMALLVTVACAVVFYILYIIITLELEDDSD